MHRVTEPELMLDDDQVKAYFNADFNSSDSDFVTRFQEYVLCQNQAINDQDLILDLGCGPGNIIEKLSEIYPSVKMIGIDGSEKMIEVAKNRQKEKDFRIQKNQIKYYILNISDLSKNKTPNLKRKADFIVANSVLHHIHEPTNFWMAIKYISKPNTVFFCRDLRRPNSYKAAKALQERYLAKAPSVLIRDYLASLKASFTVEEVKAQLSDSGLSTFNVSEVEDRYLEVAGIFS